MIAGALATHDLIKQQPPLVLLEKIEPLDRSGSSAHDFVSVIVPVKVWPIMPAAAWGERVSVLPLTQ